MIKYFVHFLSPGTFVAEMTTKEIDSWDIDKACEMARSIKERYAAVPFAFYFTTRERTEEDFDSKVIETSKRYFLGGDIQTYKEIKKRNDPGDKILLENMRNNNWDRVIVNTNSWRWTQVLNPDDVVLDFKM